MWLAITLITVFTPSFWSCNCTSRIQTKELITLYTLFFTILHWPWNSKRKWDDLLTSTKRLSFKVFFSDGHPITSKKRRKKIENSQNCFPKKLTSHDTCWKVYWHEPLLFPREFQKVVICTTCGFYEKVNCRMSFGLRNLLFWQNWNQTLWFLCLYATSCHFISMLLYTSYHQTVMLIFPVHIFHTFWVFFPSNFTSFQFSFCFSFRVIFFIATHIGWLS